MKLFGRRKHPQTGAPLQELAEVLKLAVKGVRRQSDSIQFQTDSGKTLIIARPATDTTAGDSNVSYILQIRTEWPKRLASITPDRVIARSNTMAALGALVRDRDSKNLFVVSRLSAYKGDEEAWRLYLPLVATAAIYQGDALLAAIRGAIGVANPRLDLPEMDLESKWSEVDFGSAAKTLQGLGICATCNENGLTASIPHDPEYPSSSDEHDMSLIYIRADTPHPALGQGLFYRLEIPVRLDEEGLEELANELNHIELSFIDSPPFFGAWCSKSETGRISYVGFWPNILYRSATVANHAIWMMYRNKQARDIVHQQGI